jgi:hypothetical protein
MTDSSSEDPNVNAKPFPWMPTLIWNLWLRLKGLFRRS